jgi:hypothetical protein
MENMFQNNPKFQKRYIIMNREFLSIMNKNAIIDALKDSLVDVQYDEKTIFPESSSKNPEVNINLDEVEKIDPKIISNIYNIVKNRRDSLNTPAP